MIAALNKYRHAFLIGLQSNIVYRWNFAIRGGFSFFHLVVVVILWSAIYASGSHIGGFTLGQTITYFVSLIVLNFFIGAFNEDYQISEEIRNGLINQFLLKPINYYLYRFSIYVAARLVSGALVLIPVLLSYPLLREYLTLPSDFGWRLATGIPAVAMAGMIQFTIAYCFGLMSFWFLEIQGFIILSLAIETLLGGQMFPLDLMPERFLEVARLLPFYYQMYFPAAIFTGRFQLADQVQVFHGLIIQACWVVFLLGLAQFLWSRGLRRHTAVGG